MPLPIVPGVANKIPPGRWAVIGVATKPGLIVITFTPHVSRARYIVGKCFGGDITMVASPAPSGFDFWTWMFIRQSGSYVKAFLNPNC